ncbi:hypothetical protein [Bradyrhizobium sp. 2TAF24]|uniref:hypothetical protein n=1 Tax=Bradyrhizobium sp. 2TAF24 TaxID=3233011 RepID=UPI003F937FE6
MIRSDIFTPAIFTTGKFTAAWFTIAFLTGLGVMVGMTTDPSQGTPHPPAKPDQLAMIARPVSAPAPTADGGTLTKSDRLDLTARPAADTAAVAPAVAPAPAAAAPAVAAAPARPNPPAVAARWDNANASAVDTRSVGARAADTRAVDARPAAAAAPKPAPPKPAALATRPPAPAKPAVAAARQEIRPPADVRSAPPRVAARPAPARSVASARTCQPSDNPFSGLLQSLNLMQRCDG